MDACERCLGISDVPNWPWQVTGMEFAGEMQFHEGKSRTPLRCNQCGMTWERTYDPVANSSGWRPLSDAGA